MALFKSSEERRIEREMKIRQGIRRIERAIREQAKFTDEFVANARRAQAIGDTKQYQFIRNSLKKTMLIRKVLERQLLSVKNAMLIKRQAEASADFTRAMGLMAAEIGKLFGETDLVKTQADWEKAMMQSQTMEERMNMFLDSIEDIAAQDVEMTGTSETVADEEVDRLIAAEAEAEQVRESDRIAQLRAELEALKGQSEKQK
ncbi:MAG TPA: hypothetical protein PL151_18815 [Phycisphaerae bacterium]|nr:hypothetical protein [Phycisphaerae bacterium]HOJ76188.1 hypothetical protein [Phycisphaerae bacterium]HOM53522.1 hypothetical protein [Phycisphaerae bacterium]HON65218.1 hypothetical protein [Phycisphaerae bacterium]HOQ86635.1 hypothetical protein [Phycisphaerae bacterium]